MTMQGWQTRLDEARTPQDVVVIVREFLSLQTPQEREQIPMDLRPGTIDNAQQVNLHALRFAHRDNLEDAHAAPALHRMATFFTKAALRLFELLEEPQPARDAQPDTVRERGTLP